ncbi:MAG: integrase [Candidatus Bathyarchaeia archaeon]
MRSPGFEPGSSAWQAHPTIDYHQVKAGFIDYLESHKFNRRYIKCILSYLDKYATIIAEPSDIHKMFSKLTVGQQHNLNRGIRNLLNFMQTQGYPEDYLNLLRKSIPKEHIGVDLKVPEECDIVKSLKMLNKIAPKYSALYNLLLDSGLRLIEAIETINNFKNAEGVNGFYRITVGMFRNTKQAYYAYLTDTTYNQLLNLSESINPLAASHYYLKYGLVAPKYLRKFAFDKMVQLEIPESVADFIEGRVAKRIGAKHYMALRRQADNWYSRYADYLNSLRSRL